MTVAATGSQSKALENLRAMVAASSSFQTLVGAADADAAKAHVYLTAVADPVASKRPFALVRQVLEGGFRYDSLGLDTSYGYRESGSLDLIFAVDTPAAYQANEGNAQTYMLNTVEAIIEDLMALSGYTHLLIRGLTMDIGPIHSHRAEDASEGDYWLLRCLVDWGLEE